MPSSSIRPRRLLFLVGTLAAAGCGSTPEDAARPLNGSPSPDGSVSPDGSAWPDGSVVPDAGSDGCPANQSACSTGCVDTGTDANHCGGCEHACEAGQQCHGGTCGGACVDDCTTAGTKECSGAGLRTCGEYDGTDVCLEWSAVQDCASGSICNVATVSCQEPCGTDCDPFSIVLLPDTQYYTSKQSNTTKNTYRKQMQWILDHRQTDNIRFVIHLGDVTNSNAASEWSIADTAHGMLDAASMPYSVIPGNHDYLVGGSFDRGGSHFDDTFGPNRYAGQSWYGGSYGSSNTNNYTFFEVGLLKFMVVSLEYAPRKDVLCWADDLIASHPDRRVIVATHCFLTRGGNFATGCPDPGYTAVGSDGATVWDELVSRHSNLFMVVSGHIGGSEHRIQKGNTGNEVHELLVDYQFEAACTNANPATCKDNCQSGTHTGNGWMRELTFDPRKDSVHAETVTVEDGNTSLFPGGKPMLYCSPLYAPADPNASGGNWYSSDPTSLDHRFDFSYPMTIASPYTSDDLGKQAFSDRTVNTAGTGDQLVPSVALAPGGGFVVAWEDDSSTADGAGNHDIMARGFGPGGCSGFADVVVNTQTAGHQTSPAMAADASGNFVVVWADDQDDNGVYQIYGRGFSPDGSQRIPTFVVNTVAAGQQKNPAVAMALDGAFVVAWEDEPTGSGTEQIVVRGFDANGTQRFGDRSVHSDTLGQRIEPALGMDASGGFVVAWQDDSDGNGSYQVHARGFDSTGAQRFARITVNTVATGQQRNPSIGVDALGGFLVAWEDDQDGDGNYQILARGFATTGTQRLADFRVHAATAGQHLAPSVSAASDGSFAVGWEDDGDGNGSNNVRVKTFHGSGAAWLAERVVNLVTDGQQLAPGAALNAAGTLVTVWADDMDGNGSYQILARGMDGP